MEKNEIKELVVASYKAIKELREGNNLKDSCLIFPKYSGGDVRVSEQELKQIFIELFTAKYRGKYFYSVETPTLEKYNFKDEVKVDKDGGKSAMVDMTIHGRSEEILALIEFKAKSVSEFKYKKDLLKLEKECENNSKQGYFIHLLDTAAKGTFSRLQQKQDKNNKGNATVYTIVMKGKKEGVYEGKNYEEPIWR